MKIVAVVGNSNCGKTRLITHLIPILKQRGSTVAVIKHCSHGFTLSPEGKDSWLFTEAGSDAVCMVSEGQLGLLRADVTHLDPSAIAAEYFADNDVVIVEGGRWDKNIDKIEILRKGISETVTSRPEELLAVVSDVEVSIDKPVYHPDQIKEIADLLESQVEERRSHVLSLYRKNRPEREK